MLRSTALLALLIAAAAAGSACAQAVEIAPLAAPDAFSTPGRETGLPPGLWLGASPRIMDTVLPLLTRPLTPAGSALARRVLATGAAGPGGGDDPSARIGARASALLAQGDPKAAAAILARAPGIDRSPNLARAAAESALLAGDDARACAVAQALSSGREEAYWLRLRTYCLAVGGQTAQAQLTFELAQAQARDAVFGRLMAAKLAGAGDPGQASLRNGLDYALSRNLGLDLSVAKPSPAVAAAMSTADPSAPAFDLAAAAADVAPLAALLAQGEPVPDTVMRSMSDLAGSADPKIRARGQAAVLFLVALAGPLNADLRALVATMSPAEGKTPLGRNLALESAAAQKLSGETAMLALWTCAEAGVAGPSLGDRVRIIAALHAVGLAAEARAFAVEGLLALK